MILDLICSKWRLILFIVVFAIIFNSSIFSILGFRSEELMYDYDVTVALCLQDSTTCAYSGELQIANTGKVEISDVEFNVIGFPDTINRSFKILNLTSSSPRKSDPEIDKSVGKSGFSIKSLAPGTLVVVEYSGWFLPSEQSDVKHVSIQAYSDINIVEADPHSTMFGRFFSSVFIW